MQMWVRKASTSLPGLELPTGLKHMLPAITEARPLSSSGKGRRREVEGAHARDTAGVGVGGSRRARIPVLQGFAIRSLMLDS